MAVAADLRLKQPEILFTCTQPHETKRAFIAGQLGFQSRTPGMVYGLDELVYAIIQDVFCIRSWLFAQLIWDIEGLMRSFPAHEHQRGFLIAYRQSEQERIKYELQSARDQ
jgi:hypothetical protein